jgi:hypothetical protein
MPGEAVHREVIAFLSRVESYGMGAQGPVERIDTHCSTVFLVGRHAYKLKRAIAFASLDYTTTERREAACRAELALNRRTAPELYLAVRPINRSPSGGLAFDGPGPPIDWVVVMRRFEQDDAVLSGGYSVVVDAPVLGADRRASIADVARRAAVPFAGFRLARLDDTATALADPQWVDVRASQGLPALLSAVRHATTRTRPRQAATGDASGKP